MIERTKGQVLIGGERMLGKSELDGHDFSLGSFFAPTVISDIDVEDELWQEEIFGPVVVTKEFSVSHLVTTGFVADCSRARLREYLWPTLRSTDSEQGFGHQNCQELIE